jgi:DNA-binding transcriptional LysR family regulator
MSLSSIQLEAFVAVARDLHFSNAAKSLSITQSALSLRIQNLEEDIGTTLFIRSRAGIQLTDTARDLLRYCRSKDALEAEVLDSLRPQKDGSLGGWIRIAGFSSVMRSLVVPALAPLLRENRRVRLHLLTRELEDLPGLLRSGEADFLVLDSVLEGEQLESLKLGVEENVLVAPARGDPPQEVFLDHDEKDQMTYRFFEKQRSRPPHIQRLFLDDIYGIIDGVKQGLGRAVVPRHLAERVAGIRIEKGFTPLKSPIMLHSYRQAFSTRLHQAVIQALKDSSQRDPHWPSA